MKKLICLFMVFSMMLSGIAAIGASMSDDIIIMVNGDVVETDNAPYIKNDRTMVPMRAIFEALGATVKWDDTTKTAIGVKGDIEVKITIGENLLYKNGEAIILDAPAEITNNRTMVPVRAISEAFGAEVAWDNDLRTVKVLLKEEVITQPNNENNDETTVIRIGTHAIYEDDPYFTDPETGKTYMDGKIASAKKYALEKVKENLGVDIVFVQYPTSDYTSLIAESIEKGEPFCELAVLWSGSQKSALAANILQPIDNYTNVFYEPDGTKFPLEAKTQGHYYFMQRDFSYRNSTWQIVYNMDMLDNVPGLKETDGTTLYPAELYYRGEWTWSNFENYLEIILDYCKNYNGYIKPVPFETNYSYFAAQALHSVGSSIYDGEKMNVTTPEALKAVEFTKGLFEKGLVSCESAEKNPGNTGWINGTSDFINRKTFFTNCAPWKLDEASLATGGNLGVVPFPYPDGTNPTNQTTAYRHMNNGGDSVGLVGGVDSETARLAVQAYKTYMIEYHKRLTLSQTFSDFVKEYAETDADNNGININHPEVGKLHVKIWTEYGQTPINEYSEAYGLFWKWIDSFGKYTFANEGLEDYKTAVKNIK